MRASWFNFLMTRASATVWRWKEFPRLTSRAPRLAEKGTMTRKRAECCLTIAPITFMSGQGFIMATGMTRVCAAVGNRTSVALKNLVLP
jgi:hypothetical protein